MSNTAIAHRTIFVVHREMPKRVTKGSAHTTIVRNQTDFVPSHEQTKSFCLCQCFEVARLKLKRTERDWAWHLTPHKWWIPCSCVYGVEHDWLVSKVVTSHKTSYVTRCLSNWDTYPRARNKLFYIKLQIPFFSTYPNETHLSIVLTYIWRNFSFTGLRFSQKSTNNTLLNCAECYWLLLKAKRM